MTCRYRVPLKGLPARRLEDHALGPLSPAEARKLFWRLPALDACSPEEQEKARNAVGGHPRTLEYLDALLQGGKSRFKDLELRLEGALRKRGVEDPGAWLAAKKDRFDQALDETIVLAADDVLLEELLTRLAEVPLARRLLLGASAYRLPVEVRALVWQIGEPPALPRNPEPDPLPDVAVPAGFAAARDTLACLGLLAPAGEKDDAPRWLVHRWTATRLAERSPADEVCEAHRRAARYWRWRSAKEPQTGDLLDPSEARHHHRQAGELAEAVLVTGQICSQLETWCAYGRAEQLIREAMTWLPAESIERSTFCLSLGVIAHERGNYDEALRLDREALVVAEKNNHRSLMATCYHEIGFIDQVRGNFDNAVKSYQASLGLNEGNRSGEARIYHQLGLIEIARGNLNQALIWLSKALPVFEEEKDESALANSYYNLGMIVHLGQNLDQARSWYYKSLKMYARRGRKSGVASCYHQLGLVEQQLEHKDSARALYRKSLAINEDIGNLAGVADNYGQFGSLLMGNGELAEAVPMSLRSLAIHLKLESPQVPNDLHVLGRQCEMLGPERFREILAEHLDPESRAAVLKMLDSASTGSGMTASEGCSNPA